MMRPSASSAAMTNQKKLVNCAWSNSSAWVHRAGPRRDDGSCFRMAGSGSRSLEATPRFDWDIGDECRQAAGKEGARSRRRRSCTGADEDDWNQVARE